MIASRMNELASLKLSPHTSPNSNSRNTEQEVTLTRELIDQCRTNGAFTNATLNALGLTKTDLDKGWTFRLRGRKIPLGMYESALAGRFVYKHKINKKVASWTEHDIQLNQRLRDEP